MDTITDEKSTSTENRLGKCEVCNLNLAKYTCPKCEVKTCQIECLRIHKKELNCDGVRDKTKYIPLKQITESDLMGDYVFLESCTNYTSARRTDKTKRFTARDRTLPVTLMKLKKAAADAGREIKLDFLLPNFDKHKSNKTYYDWTSKVIYWCIEWRFINADNKILVDERCCESKLMTELIAKYFEYSTSISSLACYRAKGLDEVVLLMKAEGIKKCQNRFYTMDLNKTLQDNLRRKTIVEFPVIYVIYKSDLEKYDIINSDEEKIIAETQKHKELYFLQTRNAKKNQGTSDIKQKDSEDGKDASASKPVNFLFSNENESMDDDDDDSNDDI